MQFDAMKFSAFLKAVIYPEGSSKPISSCVVVHIAIYVSLTCYSGIESALSFAKLIPKTSELTCLILLIMNEIYPNAQVIPCSILPSQLQWGRQSLKTHEEIC